MDSEERTPVPLEKRKLVTIVTESMLEHSLLETLQELGARGWTVTKARGKGARGVRDAEWQPSGNVRIEIVCSEDVATSIAGHMKRHYYEDYAMVLFIADVEILRPEKF